MSKPDPGRLVGCHSPSARQPVRPGVITCDACGARIQRRVRVEMYELKLNVCAGCTNDPVKLRRLMNAGGSGV